jgi:hypothetical protein
VDYMDVFYWILSSYAPRRDLFRELQEISEGLSYGGLWMACLFLPIGIVVICRRCTTQQAKITLTWTALAFLAVGLQGRYWTYHLIPAFAAIALVFGVMSSYLYERLAMGRHRLISLLVCIFPLVLPAWHVVTDSRESLRYLIGQINREEYVARLTSGWHYSEYEAISTYVTRHSRQSDRVLLWGEETLLNVLSGRKAPTRFGYSYALVVKGPLRERYRSLFMEELSSVPPQYIVINADEPWPFVEGQSGLELLGEFPEFSAFLHANYGYVSTVGNFRIWRATTWRRDWTKPLRSNREFEHSSD